jgi:hypothetical protein
MYNVLYNFYCYQNYIMYTKYPNKKQISAAHQRVLDRANHITNGPHIEKINTKNSRYNPHIQGTSARLSKQINKSTNTNNNNNTQQINQRVVAPRVPAGTPTDSEMYVLSNTPNALNFNLASSVFDSNFDSKDVLQIKMVNNLDGSVKFLIVFDGSQNYPAYPTRQTGYYFIKPYDLDSPIFKGMHYFPSTSM